MREMLTPCAPPHVFPLQCKCLKRDLKCGSTTVWCQPGSIIPDVAAAGDCGVDDFMNPGCNTVVGKSITCPNATAPVVETVCTPGIAAVAGGDASSCTVCRDITFIGSCDIDAQGNAAPDAGRTVVSNCPAALTCTPGDIIDLAELGCTGTNAAASPGPLYWFNPQNPTAGAVAGVPLPTKIRCSDFLAANSCKYNVGGLASNGCTSDNTYATITIGSGPLANPDGGLVPERPIAF